MRACFQFGPLAMLLLLAGGCCASRGSDDTCCPIATPLLDCHFVDRRPLVPDAFAVPIHGGMRSDAARIYCNLLERDAQCLAATNSKTAALLEQEADALAAQRAVLFHKRSSNRRSEEILLLRAAHERNTNASAALLAYLRLAEAEGGATNLRRRLVELDLMLADVKRLQTAGLEAPSGQAELEVLRTDLIHNLVELEATIEQLNHQLVRLLGADPPPGARLWPDVDLRVENFVPNADEARGIALVQRADLAGLRLAASSGGEASAELVGALLGSSQAGVGLAGGGGGLLSALHFHASRKEAEARKCQLQTALADQERAIHQEVGHAVALIQIRLEQISLSRRRLEMLGWHMQGLRMKVQVSPAAVFDVRKKTMEMLEAEQALLHDVIEWKIAIVKLREARGDLAIECGFMAALDIACEFAYCP